MRAFFRLLFVLACSMFVFSSTVLAVDIQHYKRTNSFGFENLESSTPIESIYPSQYRFLLNLGLSRVDEPLTIKNADNSEKPNVAIDNFLTVHMGLGLQLSERLWFGATGSYVIAENNLNFGSAINGTDWEFTQVERSYGFEDVSIEIAYQLIRKQRWGLSIIPEISIPVGDAEAFIGDESIGYGATLAYEKRFEAWHLAANLGYRYSKDAQLEGLGVDYRNRLTTSVGAIFRLYRESIFLNAELRRYWMLPLESDQNPNEGYLGLRVRLAESFAVFGGASLGNFDKADGNTLRYAGGIKWFLGKRGQVQQADGAVKAKRKKRRIKVRKKRVPEVVAPVEQAVEPVEQQAEAPDASFCDIFKGLGENNKAIIQFAKDGSRGHQDSVNQFQNLAQRIVANKQYVKNIFVGGHTSKVGAAAYNLQLSKKRAWLAKEMLVNSGVDSKLIKVKGYGETSLLDSGDSSEANAKNRRTEVTIQLKDEYVSRCQ